MSDHRDPNRVGLDVNAGRETAEAVPLPETPFRIAILGDFSGRGNRGVVETGAALAVRRARQVDRDDLDEVLAATAPVLHLPAGDDPATRMQIRFGELDDFHPDRLYERLPVFQSLREVRNRLADPATFAATARRLGGGDAVPPPAASTKGADILEQILDEATPAAELFDSSGGDLYGFIQRVLRPHLVPNPDPRQPQMLGEIDAGVSATMRTILHHPDFQALEALWRSIFLLVRRLDTGAELQLHLIDLSAAELAADLDPARDPRGSGVYQLLAKTAAEQPWSLLIGAYSFGADGGDLARLGHVAAIGRLLGAPWISGAAPSLFGSASLADTPDPAEWSTDEIAGWATLRALPQAPSLGLVAPRFLVRLPYGKDTEACDRFAFEECSSPPAHDEYLWGNPALLCALLLGEAFAEAAWDLKQAVRGEVAGLPLHLYRVDGETRATPCAETLLTELAGARLLERGIMPLATMKDSDTVRILRLQSVAEPLRALAGRWAAAAS